MGKMNEAKKIKSVGNTNRTCNKFFQLVLSGTRSLHTQNLVYGEARIYQIKA